MNNSKEWIESFNLHYNNSDKSAPELNSYEISLFLTQAQDEIVKEFYSGKNIYHEAVDSIEHIRTALEYLVRTETLNPLELSKYRGYNQARFKTADNIWYPINEQVIIPNWPLTILVIPTTWDELNVNLINPFKKPNERKVFKLTKNDGIYIISSKEPTSYEVTYLIEPEPIILEDLSTGLYEGMGLSIKGETKETLCKLGSNIHLNILNRAVELALRDYNPSNLEAHVQLNQRNF